MRRRLRDRSSGAPLVADGGRFVDADGLVGADGVRVRGDRAVNSGFQRIILSNVAVAAGGDALVEVPFAREVTLWINCKVAPTGTNPTLTFTLEEVDPGDRLTRYWRAGSMGFGNGTQFRTTLNTGLYPITIPVMRTGMVRVSWTVGGTTPVFPSVYATLLARPLVGVTYYEHCKWRTCVHNTAPAAGAATWWNLRGPPSACGVSAFIRRFWFNAGHGVITAAESQDYCGPQTGTGAASATGGSDRTVNYQDRRGPAVQCVQAHASSGAALTTTSITYNSPSWSICGVPRVAGSGVIWMFNLDDVNPGGWRVGADEHWAFQTGGPGPLVAGGIEVEERPY